MPKVEDAKREAQSPPLPEMGTPAEVAEFVRTTTGALSQDRYLGRGIPYVKHGKRVLYRWDDVRAYLAAHRVDPGAQSTRGGGKKSRTKNQPQEPAALGSVFAHEV